MTPVDFFEKYPAPSGKKGWPDEMKGYALAWCNSMDEWWQKCRNPKHMVLVLKTMNYAEEIWKYPIMKWGIKCSNYYSREEASETCCNRIRRKVHVNWK